jgi:hypothetical protein
MKVHGSCHCGQIAYEAEIDPDKVTICHCADCQNLSGAPYRASVPAAKEAFTLLTGQPKIYVKTAESGRKRAQGFCENCGSPIYASESPDPQFYNLRVGGLKERTVLIPKKQIWCKDLLEWTLQLDKLPSSDRQWVKKV